MRWSQSRRSRRPRPTPSWCTPRTRRYRPGRPEVLRVRTTRVLLVVGLLLVAAPGHPMPDPGPAEVRYERGAFAMFTFQDGGDATFPFVAALAFGYTVDGGTERLWGAFVKGNCERDR